MKYQLIVIGASLGGMAAMRKMLSCLPKVFNIPVTLVLHRNSDSTENLFTNSLNKNSSLPVIEAEDKMPIQASTCYIAPANYHLLIDGDHFALSTGEKVNFSRPSIDVLFESAADSFGSSLIGVLMTGSNTDGSCGLAAIKAKGGMTIVQDVKEARAAEMPESAIRITEPDYILPVKEIGQLLVDMAKVS